jgi:hypothetical protein
MSLLALCSLKAAPGVTTTAIALGAVWPAERRVLVAELDPTGGDLASRFALPPEPGLLTLAAALRRSHGEQLVWRHCQRLPGGLAVLASPAASGQSNSALGAPGVLHALVGVGGDVVADCGRLYPGSPARAVIGQAAVTMLIARPLVDEVEHLAGDLAAIASDCPRLGLVMVGSGDYPPAEVAATLGVELLGVLPRDPRGAAWLAGTPVKAWALRRSALVRAAWPLARTLTARISGSGEPPAPHAAWGDGTPWPGVAVPPSPGPGRNPETRP